MNLNLIGHDHQWLILDCGITFHDRLGVDIITPDPTFLKEHQESLVGLVITHAHEDHIGAIPYLWPFLKCPIYATPFSISIIREKLAEVPWGSKVPLVEVPVSGRMKVGHFGIEFIKITHSIPEPNAIAIDTPLGTIVHTGDWKIDADPLVGGPTDISRLKERGDEGVLALLCDSTNVFCEGTSGSEATVREELSRVIAGFPDQRITVSCFASNIARIETIALAAKACNRRVALLGRSFDRMVKAARDNGYLQEVPEFISIDDAVTLPKERLLLISTGSQGEMRAALSRISLDQHPVHMGPNDVVIFSSRVIPGNEKSIAAVQNRLVRKGVKVVTAQEKEIHVSGHPSRDELKQMYEWIRPQILVPVHGEARHLQEQANYGKSCGVGNVIVPTNGTLISLCNEHSQEGPKILEHIPVIRWMWDGNRLLPSTSYIFKDRTRLSVQGTVFVSFVVDRSNNFLRPPKVTAIGIAEGGEEMELLVRACERVVTRVLYESVNQQEKEKYSRLKNLKEKENAIQHAVRQEVMQEFRKKPNVEVHWFQM